jgi:undecaprenyl diphosphate synthase
MDLQRLKAREDDGWVSIGRGTNNKGTQRINPSRHCPLVFLYCLLLLAPTAMAYLSTSTSTSTRQYKSLQTTTNPRHLSTSRPTQNFSFIHVVSQQRHHQIWCLAHTNGSHELSNDSHVPKHVAFVCDGNSRWAKSRNLPTSVGHGVGADRLLDVLAFLKEDGIAYCTMYGFSTENWRRPTAEVAEILNVMEITARGFHGRALKERYRVIVLGNLDDKRIPTGLRDILQKLERETATMMNDANQPALTVCLAVNYGGRQDIVNASLQLAKEIASGNIHPDDVTEDTVASLLCTSGIPDPDLIIRTSGECRLSNFLLWNTAYSEIYFTPELWPDFRNGSWKAALAWYAQRKRRFGSREEGKLPIRPTTSSTP